MNIQLWSKDRELMVFVNSSGERLLNAMKEKRIFSEVVETAFSDAKEQIVQHIIPDTDYFAYISDFQDQFLQAISFTLALWSKGLIDFFFAGEKIEFMTETLRYIQKQDKPISVANVLEQVFLHYNKNSKEFLTAFRRELSNLMALLGQDKLMIRQLGDSEPYDKPDRVPDTVFPQYKIGYVKPMLMEKIREIKDDAVLFAPCAFVGLVAAAGGFAEGGAIAGRIYGSVQYGK